MNTFKIIGFYKFLKISSCQKTKHIIDSLLIKQKILGTIILAKEGINGMLAGDNDSINQVIDFIVNNFNIDFSEIKISYTQKKPFHRLRIKIKDEIISLGNSKSSDPNKKVGTYMNSNEWNNLLNEKDVILIDTRNYYESKIGKFKNSIVPNLINFKHFPDFVEKLTLHKNKKIAMYCTGGIRCEKASSYMLNLGFKNVYHLQGGIIKYLEDMEKNKEKSKWEGECFVFDNRVSVNQDLSVGNYIMCHACNEPLSIEETKLESYKEGIHCPKCVDSLSSKQLLRLKERQKQVELSRLRGTSHIGKK